MSSFCHCRKQSVRKMIWMNLTFQLIYFVLTWTLLVIGQQINFFITKTDMLLDMQPCNIHYVFHSIFRKLRLEKFVTENRIWRNPKKKMISIFQLKIISRSLGTSFRVFSKRLCYEIRILRSAALCSSNLKLKLFL